MTVLRTPFLAAFLLLLFGPAGPAAGRVISYSPLTDQAAVPAHQHRMNRHFVLVEGPATTAGIIGGRTSTYPGGANLVLYDSAGEHEPRVIYPAEGRPVFYAAAVHESAAGVPWLFVFVQEHGSMHSRLSLDAGATWKTVDIPIAHYFPAMPTGTDTGGPYAAARGSLIRIGNDEWPFIVSTRLGVWAVRGDGTIRTLAQQQGYNAEVDVIGRDAAGTRFLVTAAGKLYIFDIIRRTTTLVGTTEGGFVDGWITPDGDVYVEEWHGRSLRILHFGNGTRATVLEAGGDAMGQNVFAVPTHDYSGAWIIRRGLGKATTLYSHSPATSTIQHWQDESGPEVEALHSGSSGTKLLVQVHRPRPQPQRVFLDPALAVWNVGDPAPSVYDELFMDEQRNKGFVHLDVESVAEGAPFVFDSGVRFPRFVPGIAPPPVPAGGGGDVLQEWGVVRGSLKQRLVLPAIGRTRGAFGSDWLTDVIIYNPMDLPQRIDLRFAPSASASTDSMPRTIELAPREVRHIRDALASLFGVESGTGALFIDPEHAVNLTSRTYSTSGAGTYGFGMNAMDIYASAGSARFPLTFSGAFLGSNYRTNVILTDAAKHGSVVALRAAGGSGLIGSADESLEVIAAGQQQFNLIGATLGIPSHETGALVLRPARGSVIPAVFAIDNITNDSTYFPADLSSASVRMIPAIGHVDGANDSHFRSDLYLYNPTRETRSVLLQAHMWDSGEFLRVSVTLKPDEARVIPDALITLFGRTGIARLRIGSEFDEPSGIRITSRTYSASADGGTYGFLLPPLNSFQSGSAGDTLEILGAIADDDFRTNIGLVELAWFQSGRSVDVRIDIVDATGQIADSFTVSVPTGGGLQLNDVFRARSMNVSGALLIRISPLDGTVGAYAAYIDNRTNDASYLAANLAAKP